MLTGKDWRFKQLNELIYLDEHVDGHFKISASPVSSAYDKNSSRQLTRLEVNDMPVRKLELVDRARRSLRRCDTKP